MRLADTPSSPAGRPGGTAPALDWRAEARTDRTLPDLDPHAIADSSFRLMVENLPVLCWMARPDGYIAWYNRRWYDYTGTMPDAMEGWGWQSVHDPAKLPEVIERWTRSIESGKPFEMIFPIRGADGAFRPFITRATPLRDATGKVARWYGVNAEVDAQLRAEAALSASEAKYDVLTNAMPQMVWSTLPDGYHDYYNAQWYEYTGMPIGSTDGEGWNGMFHPDDQARARARWSHSLTTGEPYEIEYRLRHRSGEYRWTLGRALPVRDEEGAITRWIGTCTDIHANKQQAEQTELLSRELSHRIKNIFAVIAGLIGLSARRNPEVKGFARELTDRIAALGRAHEFARPHSDESRPHVEAITLHSMLGELFNPYRADGRERIRIAGEDTPIDDQGATPIALLFHELATNAAKYGALSTDDGEVLIDIALASDSVRIDWREAGGPPLAGPPTREGFGTQLAALSVSQQLGGTMEREWRPEGLFVRIDVPLGRLTRTT